MRPTKPTAKPTRRDVLAVIGAAAVVACDRAAGNAAPAAPADAAAADAAKVAAADGNAAETKVAADVAPPQSVADAATGDDRQVNVADDVQPEAAAPDAEQAEAQPAGTANGDAGPAKEFANFAAPIPPITANENHYITSCCGTPDESPGWMLQFVDHGKPMVSFTLAELNALPAKTREHTLECIGTSPYGQAISNAIWTGLPLQELLAAKKAIVPDAPFIKITALDDFSTGLPASDLAKPLWIVWLMNGAPLPKEHGYPVRMLVPGRYGMKNPKWIKTIEFGDTAYLGFWETKGWSDSAVYKPNTFIKFPVEGTPLAVGKTRVQGTAYAGSDPVTKVDIRVDTGPWQPAVFDYSKGADIWTLWHFDVQLPKGTHLIQARCTTASGAQSSEKAAGSNAGDGAGYDGSMQILVEVKG